MRDVPPSCMARRMERVSVQNKGKCGGSRQLEWRRRMYREIILTMRLLYWYVVCAAWNFGQTLPWMTILLEVHSVIHALVPAAIVLLIFIYRCVTSCKYHPLFDDINRHGERSSSLQHSTNTWMLRLLFQMRQIFMTIRAFLTHQASRKIYTAFEQIW